MFGQISSNQVYDFIEIEKKEDKFYFRIILNVNGNPVYPMFGEKLNQDQLDSQAFLRLVQKYNEENK
ncbi:MAG: hypothetical protein ACTSPD_10400 [Promethearchaeota archaeon]